MGSKILIAAVVLATVVGFVTSDFEQDRNECANQLVGLAPCLPYVGGTGKAPTLDCCSGLKQVLNKSRKCLCVLIKDRDDPNLGLKINATLAATLPSSCHAPANVSECIELLHLAPNSPDAKMFQGFANLTRNATSTTVTTTGDLKGNGTTANEKGGSERAKSNKWIGVKLICGFLLWVSIASSN